jgi:hypothetical protein
VTRGLVFLPPRLAAWHAVLAQVRAMYLARHGRKPVLFRPRRFTEKMQWRKLFERDARLPIFCDKLATRDFVAARLGQAALVPLLWSGADPAAIPFERLEPPYVLKPSHASGRIAMVKAGAAPDVAALRALAAEWLAYCHAGPMAEPGYRHVPRRLMAERALCNAAGGPPVEHRLFTFDGRVRMIQTTISQGPDSGWARAFYDRDWQVLPMHIEHAPEPLPRPPPDRQARMVAMAETLASGTDHLRVDLYDVPEGVLVGELTAYSWSGLAPFHDDRYDLWLGAQWRLRWPGPRALRALGFGQWDAPMLR